MFRIGVLVGAGRRRYAVGMTGFDPGGPLAVVFAGQEFRKPLGADVREVAVCSQDNTRGSGLTPSMAVGSGRVVRLSAYLPRLAALGARFAYEDAPVVCGPAADEVPTVAAVSEGGAAATAFEVVPGVLHQL